MTSSITTKLVKDGNSVAVRIPKTALAMSGLRDDIKMEVSKGQIVLTSSISPRGDWKDSIAEVLAANPSALTHDPELADWEYVTGDGIDDKF